MAVLSRAPAERTTIAIPTWDLWLTNLVTAVNEATAAAALPAAAGTLTGTTLAANVVASSLTSVGTLTGGATGAGFTVALSTSTITGTLADARLSSNVALLNGTNAFTGANSFATNVVDLLVGQLKFPATQNASADANTLDDYEEGTWTPADGSGAGLSFTIVSAQYLKWGQGVYISCDLVYPATASGANARISGLPFTTQGAYSAAVQGYGSTATAARWLVRASTTVIDPFTSVGVNVTNVQLTGQNIVLSAVYRAAA
jgi:hypothetical protein